MVAGVLSTKQHRRSSPRHCSLSELATGTRPTWPERPRHRRSSPRRCSLSELATPGCLPPPEFAKTPRRRRSSPDAVDGACQDACRWSSLGCCSAIGARQDAVGAAKGATVESSASSPSIMASSTQSPPQQPGGPRSAHERVAEAYTARGQTCRSHRCTGMAAAGRRQTDASTTRPGVRTCRFKTAYTVHCHRRARAYKSNSKRTGITRHAGRPLVVRPEYRRRRLTRRADPRDHH